MSESFVMARTCRAAAALMLVAVGLVSQVSAQTLVAPSPIEEIATAPVTLLDATTGSLRNTPDFFPVAEISETTLPLTTTVVGETSRPVEEPSVASRVVLLPPSAVETIESTVSVVLRARAEQARRLPVKVDRSSTASQLLQLAKFERNNQVAEAFLLACELVRENPDEEFAYDAAIRTALVLGLEADIEGFYREAIKRAGLPGKYYVQLAHYYFRRSKREKLNALIEEYRKVCVGDPDYHLTLGRLHSVTQDYAKLVTVVDEARKAKAEVFPLTIMQVHALVELKQPERARAVILEAVDGDVGPWEKRQLLLEFLKLPGISPENIGQLLRATLVNETDYNRARGLADIIIERARQQRLFRPLKEWLSTQINTGRASDMEIWLASLMTRRVGDSPATLELLTSATKARTPVIAFDRATVLADAGRYAEAAGILNVLLSEQPENFSIRLQLAAQAMALNNAKQAHQLLANQPAARLNPTDRRQYCELLIAATAALGDPQRIIDTWIQLSRIASFEDIQAMGDTLTTRKLTPQLRTQLEQAVLARTRAGAPAQLALLSARINGLAGNQRAEIEDYVSYTQQAESDVQMLRFVAELAAQYASLPLDLSADKNKKSSSPGLVLRGTDAFHSDIAVQLYTRLVQLQPQVTDNYLALMRIYQMRGEVESAKRIALELAETDPTNAQTQSMAAQLLDESGFAPEALPFYRAALRLTPTDFSLWMRYSAALRAAGRYNEADANYRKILEYGLHGKPFNQPQVFSALLTTANEAGTTPALVEYLNQIRSADIPGKPEFYLSSAKLLLQIRQENLAEEFLTEFQQKYPDHTLLPDALLLLGQVEFNRGQYDRAIVQFQAVQTRFADTPAEITAAYNVGEIRRISGLPREAIQVWRQLASDHPNDDRALGALYEAATIASRDLQDATLAQILLTQFINSGAQDFERIRLARTQLSSLSAP